MRGENRGITYWPALAGVRGLAVAAVVLYHGGAPLLRGGFLGVDAFFVLSGFLITALLLAEHRSTGRIALVAFWGRRARRLLPALLVMLTAVAVAGPRLLPPEEVGLLRGDALAAIGYVANWRMIDRGDGYFAQTASPSPLQHTWSLGIEEQFYVLWPLLVAALLLWKARRLLLVSCLAGVCGSAAAAAWWFHPGSADRAYFGTDTRAQALLIGAALAVLRPRVPGVVALAGAVVTGWLWTHASGTSAWLYHGGLTVGGLAVAAVIGHATSGTSSVTARLLGLPPLVWLGRISYGVYLWHWPLFAFLTAGRLGAGGWRLLAVRCAATLAVAVVSYFAIELPVRRIRRWRWPVLGTAAAASAHRAIALAVVLATATATVPVGTAGPVLAVPSAQPPQPPQAPQPPASAAPSRLPGEPRVDILGDSVAWTVGAYLPAHPGVTVNNRAIQGCGITLRADILTEGTPHRLYPYCPAWPDRWRAAVSGDHPDVVAILLNRWELMDAKVDGAYQHVGEPPFDAYLLAMLDSAVGIAGAGGARVALLTASYTHRNERPDGGLYPEDQPARVDAWNALLRRAAAAHPDLVTVVDLASVTCPGGVFTWRAGGVKLRSDGLHFTPAGVKKVVAPWLLPRLVALAAARPSNVEQGGPGE